MRRKKHQQPKLFVFNSFYKVSRPDSRPRLLAEGGRGCTVLGLAEASYGKVEAMAHYILFKELNESQQQAVG